MGKWLLALAFGCGPAAAPRAEVATTTPAPSKLVAAHPADERPGVRARVVCTFADASPKRWSEIVIVGEAKVESCEMLVRGECEGHGEVVRACSTEPLPAALVPRGSFVLKQEMPETIRYESFATADECASAKAERPKTVGQEWLDAQIAVETRDLEEAKAAVRAAERRLAEARAAQKPDIALIQLEVERLRKKRDTGEKLLAALREQERGAGYQSSLACVPAGGS